MIRFEFEAEMIGGREVSGELTGAQFARVAEIVSQSPGDDFRVVEHWHSPEYEAPKEWSVKLWREHSNGAPPTFHHISADGDVLETGWAQSIPLRGSDY